MSPSASSQRSTQQVSRKAIAISMASTQVIAHRLTRMALAGSNPSARDQKEFMGMVLEKQLAFSQAWWAAWQAALRNPWATAWPGVWQKTLSGGMTSPWSAWNLAEQAWAPSATVLNAALTPISRKAVSNARRLSHTPLLAPRRKAR